MHLDRAIEEAVKSAAIIACAVPINNSRISHLPDSCNPVTQPSCILLILRSHGVFAGHRRNQAYDFTGNTLVASDGTIYENIYLQRNYAVAALDIWRSSSES